MLLLVDSLSFFLCNFFYLCIWVVIRRIFRILADYGTRETDFCSVHMIDGNKTHISISSPAQKVEFVEEMVDCRRKQEQEIFSFQSVSPATKFVSVAASNSSKYEVEPTKQIHGFIEESETVNCRVEELFASIDCPSYSSSGNRTPTFRFSSGENPWKFRWEESHNEGEKEELIGRFSVGEGDSSGSEKKNNQILETEMVDEDQAESRIAKTELKRTDSNSEKNDNGFESTMVVQISRENDLFSSSDSDSESVRSDNIYSQSNSEAISDDNDAEIDDEIHYSHKLDSERVNNYIRDKFYISEDEEFIELEPQVQVSAISYAKVLPVNDSGEMDGGYERENSLGKPELQENGLEFEQDYEDEMEFLQEHRDLIEQLKMEIRNSRTGGLPTILEEEPESETTALELVQGLNRPLKSCGKFEYREELKEIQRVYKMYAQKMQKLDVLNSQTIHSIGLFKLKHPLNNSIEGRKSPIRRVKSLFCNKTQKPSNSRFMEDLKRDLELVYVGHLCLSWELLQWQHRKAMQLHQNDSQATHNYSQVVNKFQLFCVLLQRFIEDERFRGPRTENYVKNRRVICSLLQVPVIKEDSPNEKRVRGSDGENTISTEALVQIIEDSMRVFQEFLRSDKEIGNSTVKGDQQLYQTDLQNRVDAKPIMLMEIRDDLQKKERRLKEIQRSGKCIVKKLQRNGEAGRFSKAVLIAEIELKLVSRVVRMSKLGESQLSWCHKKLDQVSFVNGKVVVEPSFLLFPC